MRLINRKNILKKTIRFFGFLLFILSLCFISYRIYVSFHELQQWDFSPKLFFVIPILTCAYALNYFILSKNWQNFVAWFEQKNINKKGCYYIYAVNVLTKYIPGSVFQYAGRQAMGKKLGLAQLSMGLATFFEILGLVLGSSAISFIGLLVFNINTEMYFWYFMIVLLLSCIVFFFFLVNLHKIKYLKNFLLPQINFQSIIKNFFPAVVLYILFILINGGLLIVLCDTIVSTFHLSNSAHILSIWALSWLAGFVVIGAPAGLGVREAVLIALLTPLFGSSNALLITILFRVTLTLGDVLFAGSCIMFKHISQKSTETFDF